MQGYLGGGMYLKAAAFFSTCSSSCPVNRHVAFVPGKYFYTSPKEGIETMRLNYTMTDEETIDNSIKTLSEVINNDFESRFLGISD